MPCTVTFGLITGAFPFLAELEPNALLSVFFTVTLSLVLAFILALRLEPNREG